MDAVEFFKTVNRLCKNRSCAGCPICKKGMIKDMCMVRRTVMLGDASVESIEEMISTVEQWAKDQPVKTRQSELLKMFPNVKIYDGVIDFCPSNFLPEVESEAYCKKHDKCIACRKDYWLTEVTDDD